VKTLITEQFVKEANTLEQRSPNYGPRVKSDLRIHFIGPAKTFCQ